MTAASTLPPGQGGRAPRAWAAVRVVCFDLGGTLVRVDGHPTTRKAADLLGISLDEARGWRAGESKRRRMTPAGLADALASDFGRADIRSDLEAVFEAARQRAAVPQLFDEVEPVLRKLRRRGYLLYGLSNALGSSAPASTPPCYRLLDAVMASYDIGWCKPEEQAFRTVQEAAGAEPPELLHIGDSPSTDVAGALAAGWHAAFLQRPGQPGWPERTSTLAAPRIRTLNSLLCLLPART